MASTLAKFISVILTTLMLSHTAQAQFRVNNYKKLQEIIDLYKHNCDQYLEQQNCRDSISTEMILHVSAPKIQKIDPAIYQTLQNIAEEQAQVWADTILEGDYTSSGNTELGMVQAIYQDGQLRAYHIFFFERAWFTGNCNYDYENPKSLQSCERGKINEAAFVSANLKTVLPDEDHYAEFSED